jgi:hypothetical protein
VDEQQAASWLVGARRTEDPAVEVTAVGSEDDLFHISKYELEGLRGAATRVARLTPFAGTAF